MRLVAVLALAYSVGLVACGDNQPKPPPTSEEVTSFPAVPNPDLDLLFLIDDSPNTNLYQLNLIMALPAMFDVLATLDTPPNLHIGMTTSDLGTTGSLDPDHPAPPIGTGVGMCAGHGKDGVLMINGAAVTGKFVVDVANPDGTRMTNYTGDLFGVLAQMLHVGSTGCGFEQHLAAIKRALTNPTNDGFLRTSANLGVILIGDEDDCSVRDAAIFGPDDGTLGPLSFRCTRFGIACDEDIAVVGDKTNCVPISTQYIDDTQVFAEFLSGLKDDERKLMFAAIVGDPIPVAVEPRPPPGGGTAIPALAHSCSYTDSEGGLEVADPAVRDSAIVDSLPGAYTALTSVCSSDLRPQLTRIGHALKHTIGDPCIPGSPHTCTVTDDDTPLPECPAAGDCFTYVHDGRACPDGAHLRIAVHRVTPPRAGSYVHVRCEF